MNDYDLVVIGAGTAGLVSAAIAVELGARVALIERSRMGGDCLNVGCVPSKALLACARVAADARHAGEFGVRVGAVDVDFPAVMDRMRRLRAQIGQHDSAQRYRDMRVDVFCGDARFVARDALEVGRSRLAFGRAIVATGSRPRMPGVDGLADCAAYTNESIFDLEDLPRRLLVIGGGPIGCELGQAFARFGAQVTIAHSRDRLIPRDDPDAAQKLRAVLERDGVRVITGADVQRARPSAEGAPCSVELIAHGTHERVIADAILVATGREPVVDGLGLDVAGVQIDAKRGVKVDDYLRTSNPRVFAAGDVCSPQRFTHVADAHARIAVQNALFFRWRRVSDVVVPWCTYTDPEIAQVGMSPVDIEKQGIAYETIQRDLSDVDRAVLEGHAMGFLKVHVKRGGDRILGATLMARHAGESISELALAIESGAGLDTISRTLHPYPTQAALIRKVADDAQARKLSPLVRTMLEWWFGRGRGGHGRVAESS